MDHRPRRKGAGPGTETDEFPDDVQKEPGHIRAAWGHFGVRFVELPLSQLHRTGHQWAIRWKRGCGQAI